MLIHPVETLDHIHVAIQIDIAVGRMIIFTMEIQELFIGQVRNHIRVAAGFVRINRIREQIPHDLPIQNVVRRRERTLHLIIYDAV